ncbi:MAG: hypothetical protein ACK5L3_13735 [Oscillospiraceae bacterium]
MAGGKEVNWLVKSRVLQIFNPHTKRRLNAYLPPFMGVRGVIKPANLWVKAVMEQKSENE